MKNILYILSLGLLLTITSCVDNSVDDIFTDGTPGQRISKLEEKYQNILEAKGGSWFVYYYGVSITMTFKDGYVSFKSSFNNGNDDLTTSYRVGYSQTAELIFENYSVFQAICEKYRPSNPEFQFLFGDVKDDLITMVSKTDYGKGGSVEKTELKFMRM